MPPPRIIGGCLMMVLVWLGGGLLLLWLMTWMVVDYCSPNAGWYCSYIVNGHATLHAICALLALTAAIVWWVNRTPRNKDEG